MKVKIIAFAGSTRTGSFNKMLIKAAAKGAEAAGADVVVLDLREYPLPLYDGDLEKDKGLPENALRLKEIFLGAQGLLVASPEYNGSISGVLKNTIDWISRPGPGKESLAEFNGKVVGLLSASPGALGGIRGLAQLRTIFSGIKTIVIPEQLAVGSAHNAFAEDGTMKDDKQREAAEAIGGRVAELSIRLSEAN